MGTLTTAALNLLKGTPTAPAAFSAADAQQLINAANTSSFFAAELNAFAEKGGVFSVPSTGGIQTSPNGQVITFSSDNLPENVLAPVTPTYFVTAIAHELGHSLFFGGDPQENGLLPPTSPGLAIQQGATAEGVAEIRGQTTVLRFRKLRCRVEISASQARSSWLMRRRWRHSRSTSPTGR